jgi:hypothetical protein
MVKEKVDEKVDIVEEKFDNSILEGEQTDSFSIIRVKLTPKESKALMQMHMKEDLKMVEGVFRNHICPGASETVQLRKYPGHFYNRVLKDGCRYRVPKYVAQHLNGIDRVADKIGGLTHTCSKVNCAWQLGKDGSLPASEDDGSGNLQPVKKIESWTRNWSFDSLEFNGI